MTEMTGEAAGAPTERYIELNNKHFADKQEALAYLAAELAFPPYFGGNLDALADCLSDVCTPTVIRIRRTWHQDEWFKAIKRVLRDAAKRNAHLTVK